ncbi:MAG: aminotransferase class V-fold PLP-dependent enzyme, partial [Chlamydiae bacterium]|nr:aminotransferase class V-fold PLP-dependent enzyme [Chlamydiota bacterium]
EKLKELITPRTALISISIAHGLTGVIQPFEEIGEIAKEKGILLHLDASYALGKIDVNFAKLNADYLTFSGEILHSVIGSGGLFAKKGAPLFPYIFGKNLDVPSLAALNAAALMASLSFDMVGLETARLRSFFEEQVCKEIQDAHVLFKDAPRLPNTSVITFAKVHAEALEYYIKRKGLHPNKGGNYAQHLHRLLASSQIEGEGALSFSLSRMTTEKEIVKAVSILKDSIAMLRKVSGDL